MLMHRICNTLYSSYWYGPGLFKPIGAESRDRGGALYYSVVEVAAKSNVVRPSLVSPLIHTSIITRNKCKIGF